MILQSKQKCQRDNLVPLSVSPFVNVQHTNSIKEKKLLKKKSLADLEEGNIIDQGFFMAPRFWDKNTRNQIAIHSKVNSKVTSKASSVIQIDLKRGHGSVKKGWERMKGSDIGINTIATDFGSENETENKINLFTQIQEKELKVISIEIILFEIFRTKNSIPIQMIKLKWSTTAN